MEENKVAAAAPVKKAYKRVPRKKVCVFCQEKVELIDYKDVNRLKKFVAEGGKILPRRMSGTCAKHQRELSKAIKRARIAALLPFKAD
ncbi:MAG: 30S ribosomal protein S18 [Clostridia bacterium]|jgi:small subunit ribosomal protein S18|nr:30S ribosomal protein S18 [Clostridia bacterium]